MRLSSADPMYCLFMIAQKLETRKSRKETDDNAVIKYDNATK